MQTVTWFLQVVDLKRDMVRKFLFQTSKKTNIALYLEFVVIKFFPVLVPQNWTLQFRNCVAFLLKTNYKWLQQTSTDERGTSKCLKRPPFYAACQILTLLTVPLVNIFFCLLFSGVNYCLNSSCSHLCLLKPQGYSCNCPVGMVLQDDSITCLGKIAHLTW